MQWGILLCQRYEFSRQLPVQYQKLLSYAPKAEKIFQPQTDKPTSKSAPGPLRRAARFWSPAARLLGVPSASGTPSSPLLDGSQKSRRRNPAITRTGS